MVSIICYRTLRTHQVGKHVGKQLRHGAKEPGRWLLLVVGWHHLLGVCLLLPRKAAQPLRFLAAAQPVNASLVVVVVAGLITTGTDRKEPKRVP